MENNNEIWKDIPEFEGYYQISTFGRCQSLGRTITQKNGIVKYINGKVKSAISHNSGYLQYSISKDGIVKKFLAHRLVALAFIPNPDNKETVNHKNGDKEDNNKSNLEWSDYSENNSHSYNVLNNVGGSKNQLGNKGIKHHLAIQICQLDLDGKLIYEYESLREIDLETNFSRHHVSKCCKGEIQSYDGYKWEFKNNKHKDPNYAKTKIRQLDLDGNTIDEFDSYAEAQKISGVNKRGIRAVIKGEQKIARGFKWEKIE